MHADVDWLVLGDFNLLRNPSDRNMSGGDVSETLLFNLAISALGLVELPLFGKQYTWSNKQSAPLLERLDWFFTSASWTLSYPVTFVKSLVNETSDHVPCLVSFVTTIAQHHIFHFENYWLHHEQF
jgi:endonuclease/exonuclease/phosphatase family metal-dependent hydrolase